MRLATLLHTTLKTSLFRSKIATGNHTTHLALAVGPGSGYAYKIEITISEKSIKRTTMITAQQINKAKLELNLLEQYQEQDDSVRIA